MGSRSATHTWPRDERRREGANGRIGLRTWAYRAARIASRRGGTVASACVISSQTRPNAASLAELITSLRASRLGSPMSSNSSGSTSSLR